MLRRALEIMTRTQTPRKQPCRADVDQDAWNTVRFLTGENPDSSTSEASQDSSKAADQDYCPALIIGDRTRQVSLEVIKKILKMHEEKRSEKYIRSKYGWYRRQYLPRLEKMARADGSRSSLMDQINDHVARKIDEALEKGLPIHDYFIEQWELEKADEIGAHNFKASNTWILNTNKREKLSGRKVTELSSRAKQTQADAILAS